MSTYYSKPNVSWMMIVTLSIGCLAACATTPDSSGPLSGNEATEMILGESQADSLTQSDPINAGDGTTYRAFRLHLDDGESVAFHVSSRDTTPTISLYGPDGTFLGLSRPAHNTTEQTTLARRITRSGQYLVVVSGAEAGDFGSFEITSNYVEEAPDLALPSSTEHHLYRSGRHRPGSGAPMNVHPLQLESATTVEIEMNSSDFDTYLVAVDSVTGKILAENDDWGGTTDSKLLLPLEAGQYEIWASALLPQTSGTYALQVRDAQLQLSDAFTVNQPYTNLLGWERQAIPNSERRGHPLHLEVDSPSMLDATMRSEYVDSYLVLTDRDGDLIVENDDFGSGLDARILTPLEPGHYTLWATTFDAHDSGLYTIESSVSEGVTDTDTTTISMGSTIDATLFPSADIEPHRQTYTRRFDLEVPRDTAIAIDLHSTDFDAYLILEDETGSRVAENDDAHAQTTDAKISAHLPAGTYQIIVTTFAPQTYGEFILSIDELADTSHQTL